MAETSKIECDACGRDITTTGNCEDWRLVLGNKSKTPWFVAEGRRGGVVTSKAIQPPVPRTHHFCGLGCLADWLTDKHPRLVNERQVKRKIAS
jgi:hypothetical protein